jgi:2-polyprenyl-6-methoxyphenol hydroxylase-like FAD-dependent oxidoreductase
MQVLVIGAGVAGPAAATFLRRIGCSVTLVEARPRATLFEEGAFLGLAPNGMAVLRSLGIADAVLEVGSPCTGFRFLNARGRRIAHIDRSRDRERFGSPLVMVRRADLVRVNIDRAEREGVELRFDTRVVALSESASRVDVRLEDGATLRADVVIGADGIRSRTRASILPDAPQPAFLNQADYGGAAPAADAPVETGENVMMFGRRAFFGAFRRPDGEIWWFHNGGEWGRRSPSDARSAREMILEAHADDPPWINDIVLRTPEVRGPWFLHDICTLPAWYRGRVCLVGDAAHACSPSAGQGAALALEDAVALATQLRDAGDPEAAFERFVALRRPRVERIVRESRRNGAPKVARNDFGAWIRDRVLPLFLWLGSTALDDQYGYQIEWNDTRSVFP